LALLGFLLLRSRNMNGLLCIELCLFRTDMWILKISHKFANIDIINRS
jgi:hypothetical protein